MTKNRSMKIAVLVLALALLTSCFVGSTFARYTSTGSGTANVTVAAWEVQVNPGSGLVALTGDALEFNLFNTVQDTKNNGTEGEPNYTENDVLAGKIAPGTKGSFDFDLVYNGEVSAVYSITLTSTAVDNLPITWKVNDVACDDLAAVSAALSNQALAINAGAVTSPVVTWEWAFGDAGADNAYQGTSANIAVSITVDQVD